VDDVVDALFRASDRGSGLIINIGTGVETSVQELYDSIARAVDFKDEPNHASARQGELQRSALDPGRAEIHLGWKPWTDLDTGVGRTLEWFRTQRATGR